MANLSVSPAEEALILLGLALIERLVQGGSGYDELLAAKVRHATMKLADKLVNPNYPPEYDAYGNRY